MRTTPIAFSNLTDRKLGKVGGDALGDKGEIIVFPEELILPRPGLNEVREIPEEKALLEGVEIGSCGIPMIFLNECPDGLERNGAFQVDVEFHLWQSIELIHG